MCLNCLLEQYMVRIDTWKLLTNNVSMYACTSSRDSVERLRTLYRLLRNARLKQNFDH